MKAPNALDARNLTNIHSVLGAPMGAALTDHVLAAKDRASATHFVIVFPRQPLLFKLRAHRSPVDGFGYAALEVEHAQITGPHRGSSVCYGRGTIVSIDAYSVSHHGPTEKFGFCRWISFGLSTGAYVSLGGFVGQDEVSIIRGCPPAEGERYALTPIAP